MAPQSLLSSAVMAVASSHGGHHTKCSQVELYLKLVFVAFQVKIARQQSPLAIKLFKSAIFSSFSGKLIFASVALRTKGVESLVADKVFPIARSYAQLKGKFAI